MACQGTAPTVALKPHASKAAQASPPANAKRAPDVTFLKTTGAIAITAAAAANQINTCCEPCVPMAGINTRLKASAPTMDPAVLAAYTSPVNRAGSSLFAAAAASANGKLAPHSNVAGKMARMQRVRSRSKLTQGVVASHGSTGHQGRTYAMVNAVQAIARASRIWQAASAMRGSRT